MRKFLSKKALLWIASAIGLSGFAIIISCFFILMVIIGAVAGSSHDDSSSTIIGGQYTCSPTGEINKEKWNAVFSNAGVLTGRGDQIISISEEKGIDPVLFASITLHESTRGTSNAIRTYNNPGGLMNPGGGGLMVFATLDEGLAAMGRTLYNRIRVDGLTTIEKLGSVYAPVGATNDPNNLNQHWVPNVTSIASELGGLIMNCDSEIVDIGDNGGGNSGVNVVDVGRKWIGHSEYVFGGGRNQSDISRGRFDCSSFVHWAFSQVGISLGPLTSTSTETLKNLGKEVPPKDMKPGDLVFFDTYKIDGHVGIYAGNGKFIGSQTNTGVAFVDMSQPYWKSKFNGRVRRILK